jgi:hypothetical protein
MRGSDFVEGAVPYFAILHGQIAFNASQRSADPNERDRALASILESYWKPIYKYLRIRWQISNEDAKDRTQGFLAQAFEKSFFERFDPARARFRTYLRIAVLGKELMGPPRSVSFSIESKPRDRRYLETPNSQCPIG